MQRLTTHLLSREPPPADDGSSGTAVKQVGVIDPHYNLERVSYGLSAPGYVHRRIRRLPLQRLERRGTFLAYTPLLLERRVELVHTFNMIPVNARRYVLSCEMELPRYLGKAPPWQLRLGHKLLASPACRSILALSAIACRQAREKFDRLEMPQVSEKIRLFRGAIGPSSEQSERRPNESPVLRGLFVGRDAPRKGLLPTLDAFQSLRAQGVDVQLTVVSQLDCRDDYVFGPYVPDAQSLRHRLSKESWISQRGEVNNQEVRRLMREHDFLILPTFDESLGWVVIEAAAEACPAISTDVYAIPELIDDGETGMLLRMPLDERSRWTGLAMDGEDKRRVIQATSRSLVDQIVSTIAALGGNRRRLAELGNNARDKVSSMYDHARAGAELRRIYEHAIC